MESVVNVPIYHHSAAYARQAGELKQYRESHFANIDCKNEIEKAIAAHFDGMRLDRHAIDGVMERYGPERVSLVWCSLRAVIWCVEMGKTVKPHILR